MKNELKERIDISNDLLDHPSYHSSEVELRIILRNQIVIMEYLLELDEKLKNSTRPCI